MPNIFDRSVQFEHIEILSDGKVEWRTATAIDKDLLEMRVSGDAYPRLKIRADGRIMMGPGSIAPDVNLFRAVADTLALPDVLYLDNGFLYIIRGLVGDVAFFFKVTGDTEARYLLFANGTALWGPGNAGLDCSLARRAATILQIPGRLELGSLGVANSAAATSPGNCQKKIEVFDDAGGSLGYLAVYDAIT